MGITKENSPNLWAAFELYAQENAISLEHEDDWREWWATFVAGVEAIVGIVEEQQGIQIIRRNI